MKKLWQKYKRFLGPAFVAFEAIMHVGILWKLTIDWYNPVVWAFTAFELSMFIYLLFDKKGEPTHRGHPNVRNLCDGCPVKEEQWK